LNAYKPEILSRRMSPAHPARTRRKHCGETGDPISVVVQQQDAATKEIAQSASAAAERTCEVSASVAQVSDAAAKTGQVANDVLNAGGELAARSDKLRAAVERFLAQVRVA
jgi:methyl-accepting chemotaxis protein